jgi:hypothetical protein
LGPFISRRPVIAADATHTIELQHTSLKTLAAHANDVLFV